ncbi:Rpn family recombination-promoting nuclease/putative transposase [Desulfococcaceae bacterium HSG9]|nr:Rpn family recombination-promoting nuclease/putative transposase [Desulfococcaceae bacterium HSG9]
MTELLTPKLDLVFKSLFSQDTELLADLINAVLNPPMRRRIRSVELLNPGILPETIIQKFIILDIRASDETGRQYDIEMQVRRYDDYNQRTIYYLSRMYAEQLQAGDEYGALKPVIGIHFLDYEQFPEYRDYHFSFELRDQRYPELCLTEDLALHIFEMPKFERLRGKAHHAGDMAEWLHFFNHAHEEGDRDMRTHYANDKIFRAFDILETLSGDEKIRLLAAEREKALKDEASMLGAAIRKGEKIGLQKGEKIGLEKGARTKAVNTAEKLLTIDVLSVEQIADATGLSLDEVRALRK